MRGSNCKALPWESFGVLYRWLLKGGGHLLEDFACGRSIILYRGKQIHFCQLFCGTAMMIIIIIVYLSLQINIKICGEYSETMSIGIVEQQATFAICVCRLLHFMTCQTRRCVIHTIFGKNN